MYGIVNKAIHGLVLENFGQEAWEIVKQKSGVDIDFFLSNEPYDDEITFKLANAAAETLNTSVQNVLITFGEYWVNNTGKKSYGSLMKAGGASLKEFLINLPNFHSRVMLIYPNLTPPEFIISDIEDNGLTLHYYSQRNGLTYFVYGLVSGLGKMYDTQVSIQVIKTKDSVKQQDHDIFKIEWQ